MILIKLVFENGQFRLCYAVFVLVAIYNPHLKYMILDSASHSDYFGAIAVELQACKLLYVCPRPDRRVPRFLVCVG